MSKNKQSAFENGKEVWKSLEIQITEGLGFFKAFFASIGTFIKKQFTKLALAAMLCTLISVGFWYFKPKVYKAEMTVSYVYCEKKIYADMLVKLNNLIQSKSYKTVAKLLNITEDQAITLKKIIPYNIKREPLTEDLSTEKIPFYITAEVSNTKELTALQAGLIHYLNNTKFIQDRMKYALVKAKNDLEFYQSRLNSIDTLSQYFLKMNPSKETNDNNSLMGVFTEIQNIHNKIQEVKGTLAFNENIEVLDGFIASEKPIGYGLLHFIAFGIIAGIIIRFLLLLFS